MKFWKYSGAGNDFVLFDGEQRHSLTSDLLARICDRRFGIGADGVLFVSDSSEDDVDFTMNYLNADGGEVGMCGNGARACVHWFTSEKNCLSTTFKTASGALYHGRKLDERTAEVSMNEFSEYNTIQIDDFYDNRTSIYMNTGVPHCVYFLNDHDDIKSDHWINNASKVRYDTRFKNGTNVNFVKVIKEGEVIARTYERGVEGETLACGTGAIAIARYFWREKGWQKIKLHVPGGILEARFEGELCWLAGPIIQVFSGELDLEKWGKISQ